MTKKLSFIKSAEKVGNKRISLKGNLNEIT